MKSLFVAASALAFAAVLNVSPASAARYSTATAAAPHWEWQYHYVGHHARYEAGWVLVR